MFLQKTGEATAKRDNKCLFIYIFLSFEVAGGMHREYNSSRIVFALEDAGPFRHTSYCFCCPCQLPKTCFSQMCVLSTRTYGKRRRNERGRLLLSVLCRKHKN